jgi:hypothetical protein
VRTQIFPLLAISTVEAALLALLPVVAITLGTRIINGLRDARLPWTPYIELAAFATGVAAGVLIFGHNTDPALLGPSAVFQLGGPWDMSFGDFIARVANPFRYDLSALLSPSGIVLLLVTLIVAAAPIVRFRGTAAMANGIRNLFLVAGGAYSTIYGLGYCLWLLNRLNFWVFLLLMIVAHVRSRSNRIVFKLN